MWTVTSADTMFGIGKIATLAQAARMDDITHYDSKDKRRMSKIKLQAAAIKWAYLVLGPNLLSYM